MQGKRGKSSLGVDLTQSLCPISRGSLFAACIVARSSSPIYGSVSGAFNFTDLRVSRYSCDLTSLCRRRIDSFSEITPRRGSFVRSEPPNQQHDHHPVSVTLELSEIKVVADVNFYMPWVEMGIGYCSQTLWHRTHG